MQLASADCMGLSELSFASGLSQPVQDMSSSEPFIVIVGCGPRIGLHCQVRD